MTTRSVLLVLASAGWLSGCGDSSTGFEGRYMVTSHTRNMTACDTPGMPVTDHPPVIRFEDRDFFGQIFLAGSGCLDAADTMCDQSSPISLGFLGPMGGGDYGSDAVFNPSGTKEACTFSYTGTRVRDTGDGTIEIREEKRKGTRAVKVCDIGAEVDDNLSEEGRTLPCESLEVMTLIEL